MKKILTILTLCALFSSQNSNASSYREIHGVWRGQLSLNQSVTPLQFDILDAPCAWGQPNETPYILAEQSGQTQIISTSSLPNGSILLSTLDFGKFKLQPEDWSETRIIGRMTTTRSSDTGTFFVEKVRPESSVACYHKDQVTLTDSNERFYLHSLFVTNADKQYCCSNGVFSVCRLMQTCSFSAMNSQYEIYDFSGSITKATCSGDVRRSHPEPNISRGRFKLSMGSKCSPKPLE